MRKLHRTLLDQVQSDRYSFADAYAYNDAVLLLAYGDRKAQSAEAAMRDADGLKKVIDTVRNSYAIAVQGRAFPSLSDRGMSARVTVIEASSWAMANCFEIEKTAERISVIPISFFSATGRCLSRSAIDR
jgi:hypothetical protein